MNPAEEYHKRLKVRAERVEHYKKLDHLIGNARLGVGLVFFAVVWATIGPRLISGWWALMPVAAFVVLVARHEHVPALVRHLNSDVRVALRILIRLKNVSLMRWASSGCTSESRFCPANSSGE